MRSAIAPFTNKKVTLSLLAAIMLALTVTSVIYAQTEDEDLEFLVLPTSGHFHHDVYSPRMEIDRAGVSVYDPVVSAIFENPYSGRGGGFSYGFLLRVNSDPDSPTVRFYVDSGHQWYLFVDEESYYGYAPMNTGSYDLVPILKTGEIS